MKATDKQRPGSCRARARVARARLARGAAALGVMAWGGVLSSCCKTLKDDDTLPTDCTGNDCDVELIAMRLSCAPDCDPGPTNGLGIYVVEGGNYCLSLQGEARFCPEAFVNLSPGGLALVLRDAGVANLAYRATLVGQLAPPGGGPAQPVDLVRMTADKSELALTIKGAGDPTGHRASDDELARLRVIVRLGLGGDVTSLFYLRWKVAGAPDEGGLRHYESSYRPFDSDPNAWAPLCVGGAGQPRSVFLGGMKVDGLTAEVGDDATATTMACETGAIDTCMVWGYTPWSPRARSNAAGSYLFGSCLQAKRAAYFVGLGDPKSYTKSGTEIFLRDPFGIQTSSAEPLEAFWSPRGAECLNPDHLRRPELRGTLSVPPSVPRCDTPPRWGPLGKIAVKPGLP